MFPTLSDLLTYLFNVHIALPIQTFGLFVALSFLITYKIFEAEFRRKEDEGVIHPFKSKVSGKPVPVINYFVNGLLGFLLGYKFIALVFNYKNFIADPKGYVFSWQGSFAIGFLVSAGFIFWVYTDREKDKEKFRKAKEELIHPYHLMPLVFFGCGFWGFIGAKLFDILEHFSAFLYNPVAMLLNTNGLTYFGGLVFGALYYLQMGRKRGMTLATLADIGSPPMMAAYGIGRIGCALAGDGDWGIINANPKPNWLSWLPDWMWSFNFPHNALNLGVPIKDCYGNHCFILPYNVYPTSFYEVVLCIGLFLLMWAFRRKIKTPGMMFYIFLLLNGVERFLIEQIRVNPKYHLLGLGFTQAELICTLMIIGGLVGLAGLAISKKKNAHKSTQIVSSTL